MGESIHIARISGNKCPCYKCDDRYPGCHGYCEKYLEYRKKLDEVNEKARLDNEMRNSIIETRKRLRGNKEKQI